MKLTRDELETLWECIGKASSDEMTALAAQLADRSIHITRRADYIAATLAVLNRYRALSEKVADEMGKSQ